MFSAQLITIGTEIVSGEVVNTNASWLSTRLERLGVRVHTHLSVRDQRQEIAQALAFAKAPLVFVTGGLGPTSDDITRDCMAIHTGVPLDFDNQVWNELKKLYENRGLALREAHRWQCHFPRGAEKLNNSAGTALGFRQMFGSQEYFVLPGPPKELAAIFEEEVIPRLKKAAKTEAKWIRWTCLGVPESEVAEKVEQVIAGRELEVGYRAQVPYVKVKVNLLPAQMGIAPEIEKALGSWIVARGEEDLAEELLKNWPEAKLEVVDSLTDTGFLDRLFAARAILEKSGGKVPTIQFRSDGELSAAGIKISADGEELVVETRSAKETSVKRKTLPYRLPLNSERGKRSAAEWAIWTALCAVNARESHA